MVFKKAVKNYHRVFEWLQKCQLGAQVGAWVLLPLRVLLPAPFFRFLELSLYP